MHARGIVVLGLAGLLLASAVAAEEGWREIVRQDGVVVETRPGSDGMTVVRGTTLLDRRLETVRAVLLDLEGFPGWIPGLSVWTVLDRGAREAVVHGRHRLPWPFADRDYVVRYTLAVEDGRFSLEARSTTGAGPEPAPGVVRLVAVHSIWELRATGLDRCEVSYTYNGDLGGGVPAFVKGAAWKREAPQLFDGLRREILRREKAAG